MDLRIGLTCLLAVLAFAWASAELPRPPACPLGIPGNSLTAEATASCISEAASREDIQLEAATVHGRETRAELNGNIIRDLFSARANDDGRSYDLWSMEWVTGSYSSAGALEALVYILDANQCHASLMSELWLLHYWEEWEIDRMVAESDLLFFKSLDVDGDDRAEVVIESRRGGQGYDQLRSIVLTIGENSAHELFRVDGFDNRGAGELGCAALLHSLRFEDLDSDDILELLVHERREEYGLLGDPSLHNYDLVHAEVQLSVYVLTQGLYETATLALRGGSEATNFQPRMTRTK